jgi:tryptophan synthase alpha chain
MGKERIERMFARVRERERPGLIVFLTAGFPDMEATLELVPALVAAGADAVELGVK